MKRLALLLALSLAFLTPARAVQLFQALTITTPLTAQVTSTLQFKGGPGQVGLPTNLTVQCTFTYGSGGTTADVYVQTSVDGGTTWTDVANCHMTTASARFMYNLSSMTPVTTEYTPTDGSLAANTAKDGIFGNQWRAKVTTTGTYAGGTKLRVDLFANGLTSFP